MFKSIKNLAITHFRENWLIDLLAIIMFSIVISILYLLKMSNGRDIDLNLNLEWIREIVIWVWAITVAIYTIKSAFSGYGDMRKSYFKLLLPASIEAKFIWEWFRTLILFGGITLGLLFAVDAGIEYLLQINQNSARSLKETLFRTNEPLNYLPIMMYIIVLWHSVVFLFSTRIAMIVGIFIIIAVWMLTIHLPIGDEYPLLYPFISKQEQWWYGLSIQLSWCSRSMEYLLSYLWLGALPIALYLLSYFRIKESEI